LRAACEASLKRLRTDRIDLYQIHAPDPDVPFAESVGTLDNALATIASRGLAFSPVFPIGRDRPERHDPAPLHPGCG
jgi:aryl-alcohol dehydrogenase-like predicted oxidoreductase